MRSVLEMIKYRLHIFFKRHLYVMPMVVLALFDGFCFSLKPVHPITGMIMLCFVLFLIMVWTGWMIMEKEDPVEEQLLQLRVVRKRSYYMGKCLFLLTVGLIFAVFALAVPMLLSVQPIGGVFSRPVTVGDLAQAFLLLLGCSCCGIALGGLLSFQVMRDRKFALLLTLLLAVVTVLASTLKKYAVVGWFMWLLPPVSDIAEVYVSCEYFQPGQTTILFAAMVFYGILYLLVHSALCYKRGF